MKKTLWFTCLAVLAYGMSSAALGAEEKKPEAAKASASALDAKAKADFSKKVDLFYQVATYGDEQKDPFVLISAVQILDDLPFGGIAKTDEQDKSGAKFERAALLESAKQYAAGDAELLAVIAKLQEAPEATEVRARFRGPRGPGWGPGFYYGRR